MAVLGGDGGDLRRVTVKEVLGPCVGPLVANMDKLVFEKAGLGS